MIPVRLIVQSLVKKAVIFNRWLLFILWQGKETELPNGEKEDNSMIKLNILNLERFLQVVNGCSDAVNIVESSGKKENINKRYDIQQRLRSRYHANQGALPLSLDIPNPKDYLNIVYYSIGDL